MQLQNTTADKCLAAVLPSAPPLVLSPAKASPAREAHSPSHGAPQVSPKFSSGTLQIPLHAAFSTLS